MRKITETKRRRIVEGKNQENNNLKYKILSISIRWDLGQGEGYFRPIPFIVTNVKILILKKNLKIKKK